MRFEAPATVKDAARLMASAKGKAYALAGGTDLLVQMKSGRIKPDLIVDLKRVPGMLDIKKSKDGWRIGAAVSAAQMKEHKGLSKDWPGVVEAVYLIGSTQVKGRATLAGNLCNASPAADSVPAMVAAGAKARIVGPGGTRTVAVEKIPAGVQKNALKKGEVVEAIMLPKRPARSGDAYLRFIPRTEMDIAVVGCGINLTLDKSGTITDARVALGAVAKTVLLVRPAAKAIIGTRLDDVALDKLAAACSAACKPINDKRGTVEFRTDVAGVLAKRVAKIAYERAGGGK